MVSSVTAQASSCRGFLQDRAVRVSLNQNNRAELIERYGDVSFKTPEENRRWIRVAMEEKKAGLYVEFTVSELKNLNDEIIKNKDLVTALVNLKKEFDLDLLSEISEGREGVETYSDYKTVRQFIPLKGRDQEAVVLKLEEGFVRVEEAYRNRVMEDGLVRRGDLDSNWFQMGLGRTADLASIAARKAKDLNLRSLNFLNSENLALMNKDRETVLSEYQILRADPIIDYLFGYARGSGFTLDAVAIYRKNRSAESFLGAVREKFGRELSLARAQRVVDFFEKVDLFSPSLVIAERTSVTVEDVGAGAFSLDFVGLGAKNLLATVEGVLSSRSVEDLILKVRENESVVTEEFERQKESIRAVVIEYFEKNSGNEVSGQTPLVKFSGDEGVIVPYREVFVEDVMNIQKLFLDLFGVSQMRTTYVRAKDGRLETDMVSFAESVEKGLKKKLTSLIPSRTLSQTQFGIWVNLELWGIRTVELMLYSSVTHSKVQKNIIRDAFRDLIVEMSTADTDLNVQPGIQVYGQLPSSL